MCFVGIKGKMKTGRFPDIPPQVDLRAGPGHLGSPVVGTPKGPAIPCLMEPKARQVIFWNTVQKETNWKLYFSAFRADPSSCR